MSICQRREPGARALWNKGRLVGLGRRPRSSAMGHPHSIAAHAVHAGTRPPGTAVDDALEMTELTVACHLIGIEVRLAFPTGFLAAELQRESGAAKARGARSCSRALHWRHLLCYQCPHEPRRPSPIFLVLRLSAATGGGTGAIDLN